MRLKKEIIKLLIILCGIVLFSCEKEKDVERDYVARVNEMYLTKSELFDELRSLKYEKKFREEYVRNWINKELLYLKAVEEGILSSDKFQKTIDISKKELAVGLYLNEYYSSVIDTIADKELLEYYQTIKGESRFLDNSYFVNVARFSDKESANNFRISLFTNEWKIGIQNIINDSLLVESSSAKLLYEYQINSLKLLRVLKRMRNGDISPVINAEHNIFIVVQLIKKFNKGDESVFNFIKDEIREQYMVIKKMELEKALIENLYSEYDVELKLEN